MNRRGLECRDHLHAGLHMEIIHCLRGYIGAKQEAAVDLQLEEQPDGLDFYDLARKDIACTGIRWVVAGEYHHVLRSYETHDLLPGCKCPYSKDVKTIHLHLKHTF